jgi:hypothetical protein
MSIISVLSGLVADAKAVKLSTLEAEAEEAGKAALEAGILSLESQHGVASDVVNLGIKVFTAVKDASGGKSLATDLANIVGEVVQIGIELKASGTASAAPAVEPVAS